MAFDNQPLIKAKIKGRTETYYLVSESDLNNIKTNKITGEFFLFFATGLIGFFSAKSENYFLLILGILSFSAFIYFSYFKKPTIKEIVSSGEAQSVQDVDTEPGLVILEAIYGTPEKHIEVKQKLSELIRDNKLTLDSVKNESFTDPDPGKQKKLTVKYRYNGLEITKVFDEYEVVQLP